MLGDGGAPIKDVQLLEQILSAGSGSSTESEAKGWAWYLSEASDRLIRDVYTALLIMRDYAVHGPTTEDWGPLHQRGADRMLALCQVNRGVYIKLGQHIGALDYLLPHEYVSTLRVLQGAAPTDPLATVRAVISEEFGGASVEELFDRFDPVPLASASLAQVHVAYLKGTGEKVAIKVQHRGLVEMCDADIATVRALLYVVKALFPRFDYLWLGEELERNLPLELNFVNEAANCEATGARFAHRRDVVVPRIHHALTTRRVLTMSFEEGVYANRAAAIGGMGLRPADVALLLSEAFCEQIFVHGVAHADPHAANVLVRRMPGAPTKPQLVLLDHGLYRSIPQGVRLNYAKLWRSIILRDEEGMRTYSGRLGAPLYQLFASMLTTKTFDQIVGSDDPDRLRAGGDAGGFDEARVYAAQYAVEIGDILRQLPRELLLILKTHDNLRSLDLALGAPVNNYLTTARYCQRAVNEEHLQRHRHSLRARLRVAVDTARLEARLRAFSALATMAKLASRAMGALGIGRGSGGRPGPADAKDSDAALAGASALPAATGAGNPVVAIELR